MNKRVLITGGTSGIGKGIAEAFSKAGYHLELVGLEENGQEIAASIAALQPGVIANFHKTNIGDYQAVKELAAEINSRGGVDVLVNCAGIQHVSAVEAFPVDKWNAIIQINLSAAFYLTRELIEPMKQKKFGRIINIASAHGLVASEFKSAYVAAKHGLVGFTKVVALEGAPYGITCNAICPGYVKTPLVEKQISDQAISHGIPESEVETKIMLAKQPVKSFVSVESIGSLSVYLAGEQAALITGSAMPIDGGWQAQ
jgi:3-hydroxybutyrate dehydrogenase